MNYVPKDKLPNLESALNEPGIESGVAKPCEENLLNETVKTGAITCESVKEDSPHLGALPTEEAKIEHVKVDSLNSETSITEGADESDVAKPGLEAALAEGASESEKIVKTMSEAVKDDSLDLESSLTKSGAGKHNEDNILNKSVMIVTTTSKSLREGSQDSENSVTEGATEIEAEKAKEENILIKSSKIETSISESPKENLPDLETADTVRATEIDENVLNKPTKIVTTMSLNDGSHDLVSLLPEGANESKENILRKTVKIVPTISESIKDDLPYLESSLSERTKECEVREPNEENNLNKSSKITETPNVSIKENSCDLESSRTEVESESEEAMANEANISNKTSKIIATAHETKENDSLDLESSLMGSTYETAVAEPIEENIIKTPSDVPMEDSPALSSTPVEEAIKSKIAKPNEVPLNQRKELTDAKVTEPKLENEIGNEDEANSSNININLSPPTLDEKNAVDTHNQAKRARIHSPPRKLYAVLKPPMDETTIDVLPIPAPVQSPEEIAKRIQSRFPASISVCVKTSVEAEDVNNTSPRNSNISIEPKVIKTKTTTSASATATAAPLSSTIGAVCTPNSTASNISTPTPTTPTANTNNADLTTTTANNSSLCTPLASKLSSTIGLPCVAQPPQLKTNKIIKSAIIKTSKRPIKFAVCYPPSIASNAIRKSKLAVSPVKLLARNCVLVTPKPPLFNDKALVTSIKFLPRLTTPSTAANSGSKLQTPCSVAEPNVSKQNLQKIPPDSSKYSFDNLTLTNAEQPKHADSASMPNFSYSYLRSLSAYIREAKSYHAKFSKTTNAECNKDPLYLDNISDGLNTQHQQLESKAKCQGGTKERNDADKLLKVGAEKAVDWEDPLALDKILDDKDKQKKQLVAGGAETLCQESEKKKSNAIEQLESSAQNAIDFEDPLALDAILADISTQKQQLGVAVGGEQCLDVEKKKNEPVKQLEAGAENVVGLEDIETDLITYEIFNNEIDSVGSSGIECTQTKDSTMEVLSKVLALRETVKQQAEEIISLKAAMKFLKTKIDIENVSP